MFDFSRLKLGSQSDWDFELGDWGVSGAYVSYLRAVKVMWSIMVP